MYRLYLLRHAEAAPVMVGGRDIDRPLSDRGRQDAEKLGISMREAGSMPASVLSSSAVRARETWEKVASRLASTPIETCYAPELYRGDAEDYRILIATAAVEEGLLVVGHNPMIHELALVLLRADDQARSAISGGFLPGALAVLDFPEPLWSIRPRTASLTAFLLPGQ